MRKTVLSITISRGVKTARKVAEIDQRISF